MECREDVLEFGLEESFEEGPETDNCLDGWRECVGILEDSLSCNELDGDEEITLSFSSFGCECEDDRE